MGNQSTFLAILITISVVLIFALAIWAMIMSGKKETRHRIAEAAELGFSSTIREKFPFLLQKIKTVNPRWKKYTLQVRHVFERQTPDGVVYLYDLWDTGGEDSSELQNRA